MGLLNKLRGLLTRFGAILVVLSFFGKWITYPFGTETYTGFSLIVKGINSSDGTEMAYMLIITIVLSIASFVYLHGGFRIPLLALSLFCGFSFSSAQERLGYEAGGGITLLLMGSLFIFLSLFFWKRKDKDFLKENTAA